MEYPWGVQVGIVIIVQVAFFPGLTPNIEACKARARAHGPIFSERLGLAT